MNRPATYILSAFALLLGIINTSTAQRIKAGVDRNRIFIGEQIQLKLSLEGARPGLGWFNLPDSLNHFEVIGRSKIDTVTTGGTVGYYQVVSITSFDSGRWQIPGLAVVGLNQITLPITIDVLPVDVSHMQDYHEIKEIEEVQAATDWWILIIIAIVTLLSIAALYFFFARKRKETASVNLVAEGKMTPLEWALSQLEKLNKQPSAAFEVKRYYSDLHDISRKFFEMQLQQKAQHQTTDEWMIHLQDLSVDGSVKTSFFQFLRLADTVKFAKYLPAAYEHTSSVDIIKQMLQRVAFMDSNHYSKYQPK